MIRLSATTESKNPADLIRFLRQIQRLPPRQRRKIADAIRRGIARNFSNQRAGDGAAWTPLAPSTVADRILEGYAGRRPILVRTGSYRDSHINPNNADHLEDWSHDAAQTSVEIGSRDIRDNVLQGGAIRPTHIIPPRPVSVLDRESENLLGDTIDFVFDDLTPA